MVQHTFAHMYQFVTCALDRMKLSTVHRKKKSKGIGKKVKDKTPGDLGPADTTIHTREDGPLYNYVETVMWLVNGSTVNIPWDRSTEEESDKFKRRYTHVVEKEDGQSDFED